MHVIRHRDITIPKNEFRNKMMHTHPVYHVVLHLEGTNKVLIEGRSFICGPGDLLIVDPNISHTLHASSPEDHRRIALTFEYVRYRNRVFDQKANGKTDKKSAQQINPGDIHWAGVTDNLQIPFCKLLHLLFMESVQNDNPVYHLSVTNSNRVANKMYALFDVLGELYTIAGECQVAIAIYDLFLMIAKTIGTTSNEAITKNDGLLRAKHMVERSFAKKINVSDLARIAHYSENHFITAFRERFGMTPIAYQRTVRIRAAQNLLHASSLCAKEIAQEVGFADVQYFTRVFKKITGVSPIRFRQLSSGRPDL